MSRFELKGNLADSTVWNSGEAGDINCSPKIKNQHAMVESCVILQNLEYLIKKAGKMYLHDTTKKGPVINDVMQI